jgi:hypothetical protein
MALLAGCASSPQLSREGRGGSSSERDMVPKKMPPPKPRVCDMRVQIKINDPIAPYLSDFGTVTVRGKEGFQVQKQFPIKFGTQVVTIMELEAERYDVEVTYGDYIATKCVILGCICQDNWKEVFANQAMDQWRENFSLECSDCNKYGSSGAQDNWEFGSSYGSAPKNNWGSTSSSSGGKSGGNWWSANPSSGAIGPSGTSSFGSTSSNWSGRSSWKGNNSGSGGYWNNQSQTDVEIKGSGEQTSPCSQVTPCGRNVAFELPKDAK